LVGDAAGEFVAAAAQHHRVLGLGVAGHLFHQAGLAHAGFPFYQRQSPFSPPRRLPPGDQLAMLFPPADEGEQGSRGDGELGR